MHRWARRLWTTAGATACGVVLSLLATAVPTQAASPAVPTTARTRATAAVDAMMGFYDQETGRWQPESPWWQSGNALQALLDYMAKTGSRKYMSEVKNTIAVQRAPLEWWPQGGGEFRADSTDDTGWWALAMTRMYDLTRDQKYLDIAELDEAYMRDYWDDTCGGGIWWDIPAKSYKNAISIELYIKLAASLHNRIPGDKVYLAHALEAWQWFKDSGMINGDHLVNDGLNTQSGGCANNGGTTWTYNQGVVLGGLAELYKATGDKSLLTDARDIADAVIASPSLTQNGILTEPCQAVGDCNSDQAAFKGIFARNLGELDALLTGHPYRSYLRAQASSAYTTSRNSSHQYGLSWAGPFDQATIGRQESAVSLLTSVL
ncbi:glycoside hydrolase family 76 protein [Streptomyces sporangiiformans]|uniref:Glycosyl hydrolase n=1 Tax=Streptomyces sporangiiformans TaxID=2315329 RepID=A0A505DE80_9ACTN|nr:glycoside hydrolase family 76 protein [Streptomyces sporangiiformans]TPQ17526.1 glycosyl hydrolase [Streptomyces sporangiiformans]